MSTPTASLLLVDDDSAFRHVMASELARLGFAVDTAASGEEAVSKLREREPDVALLDLQLPGISGLEVLKVIREQHHGVEVVMLTGHGTIDTAI
jgi:DNA-binding response OmpR family regulator